MNKQLEAAIYEQLSAYQAAAPPEALATFAAMPAKDLILCHFGLGLYLRNNVLTMDSELYRLFTQEGITHKDDMSAVIISLWHRALRE